MVKNILFFLMSFLLFTTLAHSIKEAETYERVILGQRAQLEDLKYQLNQCRTLYIGL